ncbi:P-loop NTPase fold protein [Microbacterium sp. 179-I 1D1 NHS]|uniref:KAP family P-loop NTPase fold protein n=1 Tax=Microbacterium sp. 179-I 1D1 NHS TaxID=3374298 RepID=UPI0038792639
MSTKPRPERLPILVDRPTSEPKLGFENYVSGLAAAITGGNPARYTVGLYGPWGSGKSSLLTALASRLRRSGPAGNGPIVVEFDAWRYASSSQLLLPLLHNIKQEVESRAARSNKEWLGELARRTAAAISSLEVSFMGIGLTANASGRNEVPDSESFFMPFDEIRSLGSAVNEDERIIVLVDDLDRCSPDRLMDVIEAIHVLTDTSGIVFVLALDYEYLTSAIRRKHAFQNERGEWETVDADRYIEKVVQVPFHIPRMITKDADIQDIVPDFGDLSDWMGNVAQADFFEIVEYGLRANPRQVKRLLNTFLLARHMSWEQNHDAQLMLQAFGLQVAWPQKFEDLAFELRQQEDHAPTDTIDAVTAYSSLHVDSETGLEDEQLRVYLERVLTPETPIGALRGIMRLAQNVSDSVLPSMEDVATHGKPAETSFERSLSTADEDLLRLYELVTEIARAQGGDRAAQVKLTATSTHMACARTFPDTEGRKRRVFASIKVFPRRRQVVLFLPLDPELELRRSSPYKLRDVTNIGHHGVGDVEVALSIDDRDSLGPLTEMLGRAYASVDD